MEKLPRKFRPLLCGVAAILLVACTSEKNEDVLLSQFSGKGCPFWSERASQSYRWMDTDKPNCEKTGFFKRFSRRHFEQTCMVSGAFCLLELSSVSDRALNTLSEFLERGPSDIDTGDGILRIRGNVAIAYALLAGSKSIPVLNVALSRNDPAVPSLGGSFPPQYQFRSGTSHELIQQALEISSNNK